jgi:hypothetical protein
MNLEEVVFGKFKSDSEENMKFVKDVGVQKASESLNLFEVILDDRWMIVPKEAVEL